MKRILSIILSLSMILSFFVGIKVFTEDKKVKADGGAVTLDSLTNNSVFYDDEDVRWIYEEPKEIEVDGETVNAILCVKKRSMRSNVSYSVHPAFNPQVYNDYYDKITGGENDAIPGYMDMTGYGQWSPASVKYDAPSDLKRAIDRWFSLKSDNIKQLAYNRHIVEQPVTIEEWENNKRASQTAKNDQNYGGNFETGAIVLRPNAPSLDFTAKCYAPSYDEFKYENEERDLSREAGINTRSAFAFDRKDDYYPTDYYNNCVIDGVGDYNRYYCPVLSWDSTLAVKPAITLPLKTLIIRDGDKLRLAPYNGEFFTKVGVEKAENFIGTAGANNADSFITGIGTDSDSLKKIATFIKKTGSTGAEAGEFVKKAGGEKAALIVKNSDETELGTFIKTAGGVAAGEMVNLLGDEVIDLVNQYGGRHFTGLEVNNKFITIVKDGKKVLFRYGSNKSGNVTIPNDVDVIGSEAFHNNKTADVVTIPYNVSLIQNGAFDTGE